MAFNKITDADLVGKGVIGLPDTPNLSTTEMQNKFEETSRNVVIPKINEVIEGLNGSEVSNSSKAINPVSGNEESFQNTFNALKKYTDDEVTKERTKASDELKVHTDNKENPHVVTPVIVEKIVAILFNAERSVSVIESSTDLLLCSCFLLLASASFSFSELS